MWDLLTLAAAGTAPGVLVLDDAQWADEATLRLLAYGIRRLAGRPLFVVLGWRTPHDHPVRRAALAAAQSGGSVHVRPGRLGEESVAEMVRSVRQGAADPSVVRRVWRATEGVPLRLVELLRTDGESRRSRPAPGSWSAPGWARSASRLVRSSPRRPCSGGASTRTSPVR